MPGLLNQITPNSITVSPWLFTAQWPGNKDKTSELEKPVFVFLQQENLQN